MPSQSLPMIENVPIPEGSTMSTVIGPIERNELFNTTKCVGWLGYRCESSMFAIAGAFEFAPATLIVNPPASPVPRSATDADAPSPVITSSPAAVPPPVSFRYMTESQHDSPGLNAVAVRAQVPEGWVNSPTPDGFTMLDRNGPEVPPPVLVTMTVFSPERYGIAVRTTGDGTT